jgi:serine/threonine protein kinase
MADKITIMKNLCLAMQEMHSAGLIHCDFKSLNVMCDASDNYKITIIDVDGGKVGAYIGELLTTDGYRSPFVDGPSDYRDPDYYENIYNKKSDIFALGVTCLEVYYNYVMENKYGALENMEKSYDPMVRELSEIISDMLKYGEGKITTLDLAVVGSKFDKLHEKVEKPSIAVDVAKELNAEGRKKINYTSSSKELLQTIAKFRKARNYSKEENLSFESQVKSLRKTLSIGNKIYFSLCNNIKSVRNSKIAKFNPGNTY